MAFANSSFDQLVATTLKNYRPRLTENITNKEALLVHLKQKGYVKELEGGTSIVEPLIHSTNSTVRSYLDYDLIDPTVQEGISAAEYLWKFVAGTVTISGPEEFKNIDSKTRVLSLLDAKIKQLELSMAIELDRQLLTDGSGNSNKDITGLVAMVAPSVSNTFAGINTASFGFWNNQWIDATSTASFGAFGIDNMRTLFNTCANIGDAPTLVLTTQTIFERYEKALVPSERFMDTELGDAGFQNLKFKNVPIVYDRFVGAGVIYMLNRDYMYFAIGRGRNFALSPFVQPENQDAKIAKVLFAGQLVTNRRQALGLINNQTGA